MVAPSLIDEIARAVEEFGVPSVGLLALVGVTRVAYGEQAAGTLYVLITGIILLGILTSAKYWNTRYTIGFVVVGFLWVGIPGAIPQLIPEQFAQLSTVVSIVFLLAVGKMIADK